MTNLSPTFAAAQAVHTAAYAVYSTFAEADDDGIESGGSQDATDAQHNEYLTLDAMIAAPAETAGDVLAKMQYLRQRDALGFCTSAYYGAKPVPFMALIERDLARLARPTPSTAMAQAFAVWAAAWRAYDAAEYVKVEGDTCDQLPKEVVDASWAAERALFNTPCATPADFMVKSYVELLGTVGGSFDGFAFMPSPGEDEDGSGTSALLSDLGNTDLGQCMMALGRVDFDASEWVAAMTLLGHKMTVVRDGDHRSLQQDADHPDDLGASALQRFALLERLGAGGDHKERAKAIADVLEADYPNRVIDLTGRGQDTPAIADALGAVGA